MAEELHATLARENEERLAQALCMLKQKKFAFLKTSTTTPSVSTTSAFDTNNKPPICNL